MIIQLLLTEVTLVNSLNSIKMYAYSSLYLCLSVQMLTYHCFLLRISSHYAEIHANPQTKSCVDLYIKRHLYFMENSNNCTR